MKRFTTIATFVLIGIMVMCVGALAGWYLVLKSKGQTINWQDAARGFGFSTPSASQNGSTYDNLGIGAGGAGGSFNVGGSAGTNTGLSGNATNAETPPGSDGQNQGNTSGISSTSTTQSTSGLTRPKTARLWRVTKTPIAGYGFSGTLHEVFFAERATGYLFKADAWSGEVLRRTNTLVPKMYEAYFSRDGAILYRTLNETTGAVQTFSGFAGTSTSATPGTLTSVNMENNILSITTNPDTQTIFFLETNENKVTGITAPWIAGKTGKETVIFSSTVGSWKPFMLSDGRLMVAQKPQDGVSGSAFTLKNSILTPIVRAAPGLTILPLDGSNAFVFGTSNNKTLTLFAQTSTSTYALSVKTTADKCTWAPYKPATKNTPASHMILYCAVPSDSSTKNFLENWYMGALHTTDSWWRIDLTTGKTDQILSSQTSSSNIDVIDPSVDPTGALIGFKNNADGTLWVLRIDQ